MIKRKDAKSVDCHVGARLRSRRIAVCMTQTALANALGLTFQQIQKYENGSNRISASRLYQIASVLEVHVAFFFEDYPSEESEQNLGVVNEANRVTDRELSAVVRSYSRISDPELRRLIGDLISVLART